MLFFEMQDNRQFLSQVRLKLIGLTDYEQPYHL
jgi:hypothetical protein